MINFVCSLFFSEFFVPYAPGLSLNSLQPGSLSWKTMTSSPPFHTSASTPTSARSTITTTTTITESFPSPVFTVQNVIKGTTLHKFMTEHETKINNRDKDRESCPCYLVVQSFGVPDPVMSKRPAKTFLEALHTTSATASAANHSAFDDSMKMEATRAPFLQRSALAVLDRLWRREVDGRSGPGNVYWTDGSFFI